MIYDTGHNYLRIRTRVPSLNRVSPFLSLPNYNYFAIYLSFKKKIYIRVIPPFILPQKYFSFISFRVPFNLRVKSKEKRTRRWNYSLKISYPDIFLFLFLEIFEIYFIVSFNLHVKWRKSRDWRNSISQTARVRTYIDACVRS